MALSVLQSQKPDRSQQKGLLLSGHDNSVLAACSWLDICATCDASGVVLLWHVLEESAENVCRLRTKHAAVTDVVFTSVSRIACAQGDGVVSCWDVERSQRERKFCRVKTNSSLNWSVINTIASTKEDVFAYGGDDGYVVQCDTRDRDASFMFNIRAPVTALSIANDFIYAGDVCGFVHCYDVRMNKRFFSLHAGDNGVAGLAQSSTNEKLVAWCMSGTAALIDTQPFALDNSDRLLGSTYINYDEQRILRRFHWSHMHSVLIFPCSDGKVACFANDSLLTNQPYNLRVSSEDVIITLAHLVDNKYLLTASGNDVNIRSFV